jgi:hypothetical protein
MEWALGEVVGFDSEAKQKAAILKINNLYVDFNHSFVFGATEEGIVYGSNVKGILQTHATTFFLDQVTVG